MTARLILLNGAPGVGKSEIARLYIVEHPMSLLLDVDSLRTNLGQWQQHEESKLAARELAVVLAAAHLERGRDVVIPQYLERMYFIEKLAELAESVGARFVEVLLDAPAEVVVERFWQRRRSLVSGAPHPESDLPDDAVERFIYEAVRRLRAIAAERPATHVVAADGAIDGVYGDVIRML